MYLRLCKNLANKMPHSPVVDKGRPRKAQYEVPAELSRVGRVQLINPIGLQIQLELLAAFQQNQDELGFLMLG